MKAKTLSIPVFSIRRIETPYERRHGYKNYVAVIDARHLPDLSAWREINVRDAKTRGRVPNAIRRSFDEKCDEFLFMNRGLVIAAERVDFKETPGEKHLDLVMADPAIHGLLDGGHTYRVVTESAEALSPEDPPRYVRVEIVTGFDRETISDVVEARNTSNQVRDESLANLRQEFEPLKEVLRSHRYFDSIAWSEYEELETGKAKPIDVRDVISYLITFDTDSFNSTTQPLIAYKDKRACLRHFQQNELRLRKLYPLLPDILELWDEIHQSWQGWYGEGREEEAGIRGRFLKLTAVLQVPEILNFKGVNAKYRMPEAYKYPILSAMRAAIKVHGRAARWGTDPFQLLRETGPQLTNIVGNTVRSTNNPNKVGKDVGTWSSCYLVVESALRGSMTLEAEKKIQELQAQLAALQRGRKQG
jgi:AIPR protein